MMMLYCIPCMFHQSDSLDMVSVAARLVLLHLTSERPYTYRDSVACWICKFSQQGQFVTIGDCIYIRAQYSLLAGTELLV